MSTDGRFERGRTVAIREVCAGKVWTSRPVVVIEDSADQFVSYLRPGTMIDYPVGAEHGEDTFAKWMSGEWSLAPREFRAPGMLRIAPVGAAYEVFGFVTDEAGIISWYVNFERPLVRTAYGFETLDETLDLIVAADLTAWERRDEDELELATEMGVYSVEQAARIVQTCSEVEAALERGEAPWSQRWCGWTPSLIAHLG